MRREVIAFLQVLALLVIALVVSTLPEATFQAAQTGLLVAAALMLGAIAVAVVVRPIRGALLGFYGLPHVEEGPAVATPEEMRALLRPLLTALALVAVVIVASSLR